MNNRLSLLVFTFLSWAFITTASASNVNIGICYQDNQNKCQQDKSTIRFVINPDKFSNIEQDLYASGLNIKMLKSDIESNFFHYGERINKDSYLDTQDLGLPGGYSFIKPVIKNEINLIALVGTWHAPARYEKETGLFYENGKVVIRSREYDLEEGEPHECGFWKNQDVVDVGFLDKVIITLEGGDLAKKDYYCIHNNYSVTYLKNNNIAKGYSDGKFKPNNQINRAEFTKIIAEATLKDATADCKQSTLADVETSSWYENYVHKAQCAGLIAGYPDSTFKPANNINAAEVAKIVSKAFNLEATTLTTSEWFMPYVNALQAVNAWPESIDSYNKQITRGEMAEIIYRVMERDTLN